MNKNYIPKYKVFGFFCMVTPSSFWMLINQVLITFLPYIPLHKSRSVNEICRGQFLYLISFIFCHLVLLYIRILETSNTWSKMSSKSMVAMANMSSVGPLCTDNLRLLGSFSFPFRHTLSFPKYSGISKNISWYLKKKNQR